MSFNTDYTYYDPQMKLMDQLVPLSRLQIRTEWGSSHKYRVVEYKPLKINDQLFKLTLTIEPTPEFNEDGVFVYDKKRFSIKSLEENFNFQNISEEEIDLKIKQIFNSTKKDK